MNRTTDRAPYDAPEMRSHGGIVDRTTASLPNGAMEADTSRTRF